MLVATALALSAGFLFALAATLQQLAGKEAVAAGDWSRSDVAAVRQLARLLPVVALLRSMVRNPVWLTGWLVNLLGFLVQWLALHRSSVALVQPLLVSQLLFTLPLSSVTTRRPPAARDWASASLICGGIAVFLAVRGAAPVSGESDRARALTATIVTAAVAGGLTLVAWRRRPAVHASIIAVAAGLCFALSAVLMKLTAEDLAGPGVAATARDWPGYALAASTAMGLLLGQEAFVSGSLPAAITAMTIANPIASYLIGLMAFDVTLPTHPGQLAAVSGSAVLLFCGVLGLAHSPLMRPAVAGVSPARGVPRG